MNPWKILHRGWPRFVAAVILVALAAALRIWPLQGLGPRIPYVTFYPAVMVAALYGGIAAGLLATVLSAITIILWSPTGQPFIADAGDWLGMAVFAVNCTMISLIAEAMRRAQARAEKAQRQAEAANRAKSVFLATMSHELRTPLNAILGFSNLMRNDLGLTGAQRGDLDIINRSGAHLLSLINDVLDMAKIEAGRLALDIKPFDIGFLARDVVDMLGPRAEEKGLELRLGISPELPRFIQGDQGKVRQVIVNLVGNAIKYTHSGGVVLSLGVRPGREGPRLLIEVEDTGIGIPKPDQAHIFEPFVQVGKTAAHTGTGLGLAIIHSYAELMGGHVGVESVPDEGSLFWVDLPLQAADGVEAVSAEQDQHRVLGMEPGQPACRVLIVEDQEENWLLLRRLLEDAGFVVGVAENGALGVEMFQSFRPHFIWMDRRMPVMDGLEATRRIRALDGGKAVKIAAVSASVFSDQREEMLTAGLDDFVRKPYLPSEIFGCMAKHLGIRYTYGAPADTEQGPTLSPAALAGLPGTLRQELADGLVLGNVERLAGLMARVEQHDPTLAKALERYLDGFNYLPILKALEATGTATTETTA